MLGGQLGEQPGVERLGEARVGDGDVEAVLGQQVGGAERLLHAAAVADDRDALALAQDLAGADLDQPVAWTGSRRRPPPRAGSGSRTGPSICSAVWSMCASIASSRGAISVMFGSGRR